MMNFSLPLKLETKQGALAFPGPRHANDTSVVFLLLAAVSYLDRWKAYARALAGWAVRLDRRNTDCEGPALGEAGQSLVEFAVCLPVLLLVVTGIFTFGIALNNYMMLTESVSVGARVLAISRGQTTDPCSTASSAIFAAAPNLKSANMSFTFVLNGTQYTGPSCNSSSTTTGSAANLSQGASAQVTATYPCSLSVYGANYAPTCWLKAQTTQLVQ